MFYIVSENWEDNRRVLLHEHRFPSCLMTQETRTLVSVCLLLFILLLHRFSCSDKQETSTIWISLQVCSFSLITSNYSLFSTTDSSEQMTLMEPCLVGLMWCWMMSIAAKRVLSPSHGWPKLRLTSTKSSVRRHPLKMKWKWVV